LSVQKRGNSSEAAGMCPKRNKGYHTRELACMGFPKNCELEGGLLSWVVFYARAESRMRGGFAQFEGSKELPEDDLIHYWRGRQLTSDEPRDRQANNSGRNFIMGVTMPALR
jgi:hypothetical protein